MKKINNILLIFVIVLFLSTVLSIFLDGSNLKNFRSNHQSNKLSIFQNAIRGLGMGAITAPIWQFINFDFRINSVDDSMTWPVPGGYSYGPDRTGTINYFEEIPADQWIIIQY